MPCLQVTRVGGWEGERGDSQPEPFSSSQGCSLNTSWATQALGGSTLSVRPSVWLQFLAV